MIKRSHVLAAILWLSSFFAANAQAGFEMPSYTSVNLGQVLSFPTRVVNSTNIASAQFVLQWDPAVLKFAGLSLQNNPLNLVLVLAFNISESSSGLIRFQFSPGSPKTLADSSIIFEIQLRAIGANGTSSPVTYTEALPTTVFEVAQLPGPQFYNLSTALITNSLVTIGSVSSVETFGGSGRISLTATPNPFSDQVNLAFDLPLAGETQWTITDVTGRICHQEKKYLEQGRNGTVIANGVFPARGLYFVHIANGAFHAVQPIVYQ